MLLFPELDSSKEDTALPVPTLQAQRMDMALGPGFSSFQATPRDHACKTEVLGCGQHAGQQDSPRRISKGQGDSLGEAQGSWGKCIMCVPIGRQKATGCVGGSVPRTPAGAPALQWNGREVPICGGYGQALLSRRVSRLHPLPDSVLGHQQGPHSWICTKRSHRAGPGHEPQRLSPKERRTRLHPPPLPPRTAVTGRKKVGRLSALYFPHTNPVPFWESPKCAAREQRTLCSPPESLIYTDIPKNAQALGLEP